MTGEGEPPILFGASYSVYTRIARLSLEEKGVAYRLEETDVFAPGGPSPDYLVRHPFGRIPAFEWQGFRLYEASAIARYVDEIFPGPSLQPADARARARMNQVISILDSYCYRTFVWDIFVERVRAPATRRMPDEKKIATALPGAEVCLNALTTIMDCDPWLAGTAVSLADLHAAPMLIYFAMTEPEGARLWSRFPTLQSWLEMMMRRASVLATRSPLETSPHMAIC